MNFQINKANRSSKEDFSHFSNRVPENMDEGKSPPGGGGGGGAIKGFFFFFLKKKYFFGFFSISS